MYILEFKEIVHAFNTGFIIQKNVYLILCLQATIFVLQDFAEIHCDLTRAYKL